MYLRAPERSRRTRASYVKRPNVRIAILRGDPTRDDVDVSLGYAPIVGLSPRVLPLGYMYY